MTFFSSQIVNSCNKQKHNTTISLEEPTTVTWNLCHIRQSDAAWNPIQVRATWGKRVKALWSDYNGLSCKGQIALLDTGQVTLGFRCERFSTDVNVLYCQSERRRNNSQMSLEIGFRIIYQDLFGIEYDSSGSLQTQCISKFLRKLESLLIIKGNQWCTRSRLFVTCYAIRTPFVFYVFAS